MEALSNGVGLYCDAAGAGSGSFGPRRLQPWSLSSSSSVSFGCQLRSNAQCGIVLRGCRANQRNLTMRFQVSAKVKETEGAILTAQDLRFAVVAARFNKIITKPLVSGALETFKRYAIKEEQIEVIWVPGSFEIPVVAQALGKSGKYDAVLCIGAVVRGATSHYDAVANSAASGIMSASLNSGVPCIFGVLTCDTMEQAIDRAGGKAGNKGGEAALTAIEMASLLKHHVSAGAKVFV